jgi:hypothetical protein
MKMLKDVTYQRNMETQSGFYMWPNGKVLKKHIGQYELQVACQLP